MEADPSEPVKPEKVELDPRLVAEIDALEPAYPVPDSVGRITAEALDYLVHMLALDELHELLWHGYEHSGLDNPSAALWAERAAEVIAAWLRDHGIPQVAFWFPSTVAQDQWVLFKLSAAD